MPSAAAQAYYDEMMRKEDAKILPEETLKKMRAEACLIVEKISSRSKVFDSDKEDLFPSFQLDEISVGKMLGKGQFGGVHQIDAIKLAPETPESKSPKNDVEETQTREFMSKQCIRNGDARYAIKKLRKEVGHDAIVYRNGTIDFAIEAKFLAILRHPHIVKMRGLTSGGFIKANSFIIMDRLYDTLEVRLQKWKKLQGRYTSILGCCNGGKEKYIELMAEKVVTALDLSNAMEYMHGLNIMYRDLKTENIGFDVRDEVKIFDFGLAKELQDSNRNEDGTYNLTGFTGSILYMAPEVALSKPYNKSADVFSFSILLWIMMALEQPYKTLTPNLIKKMVFHKDHRPQCDSKWPEGISNLIKECWTPNLQERPSFVDISTTLSNEWSNLSAVEYDNNAGLDLSMKSARNFTALDLSTRSVRNINIDSFQEEA